MSSSLVIDVSIAESIMSGDASCYNLLRIIHDSSAQIVYSETWLKQWETVVDVVCPSEVPITFKEYVATWISAMVRRSRDGFAGLIYSKTSIRDQCIIKTLPENRDTVFNAWTTIELALYPDAARIIIFKATSPQGAPTPCQVFRNTVALFASQELAKICWAEIV